MNHQDILDKETMDTRCTLILNQRGCEMGLKTVLKDVHAIGAEEDKVSVVSSRFMSLKQASDLS